jgi:tagatose-6-phosphate ketose/aldose isomerase
VTTLLGLAPTDLEARGGAHTAREIGQQPALWREVGRSVAASRDDLDAFLQPLLARPDLRIILTGAGTSSFVGQILAPVLTRRLGRRIDAVSTTDIVSNPRECFAEDVPTLLVSFARSGDSPESVAAAGLADQCLSDVAHLVVTCNPEGRLTQEHAEASRSYVLFMPAESNDLGFAMTSSFTCMTLAGLLALGGQPDGNLVERLARAAEEVLATRGTSARDAVAQGVNRIVYLGSGSLTGLARESALKVLELTAGTVVATADSSLGFRHGPKAVLDDRTLAVVYLSDDDYTRRYDEDMVAELRAALPDGRVVTVGVGTADEVTWALPGLDGVDDAALALVAVLAAQLIGLYASLARGCTPDNPFPSGSVNRVVQGVTLHPLTA